MTTPRRTRLTTPLSRLVSPIVLEAGISVRSPTGLGSRHSTKPLKPAASSGSGTGSPGMRQMRIEDQRVGYRIKRTDSWKCERPHLGTTNGPCQGHRHCPPKTNCGAAASSWRTHVAVDPLPEIAELVEARLFINDEESSG